MIECFIAMLPILVDTLNKCQQVREGGQCTMSPIITNIHILVVKQKLKMGYHTASNNCGPWELFRNFWVKASLTVKVFP